MCVAVKYSNTMIHLDNSVGQMIGYGLDDSDLMLLFFFTLCLHSSIECTCNSVIQYPQKRSDASKCYFFVIMIHNLMKLKTECRYMLRLWVSEVLHVDHL